jgi:hypothetical protein
MWAFAWCNCSTRVPLCFTHNNNKKMYGLLLLWFWIRRKVSVGQFFFPCNKEPKIKAGKTKEFLKILIKIWDFIKNCFLLLGRWVIYEHEPFTTPRAQWGWHMIWYLQTKPLWPSICHSYGKSWERNQQQNITVHFLLWYSICASQIVTFNTEICW